MKQEIQVRQNELVSPIPDYQDLFFITSLGRVVSIPKVQNGNKNIERKLVIDNRGYLRVSLGKSGVKKTYKVHRLVAAAFIPNPKQNKEVNHIDGNKLNNNVSNLEWCNRSENILHAFKNSLCIPKRGILNGNALLNEQSAIEIFNSTEKNIDLAKKYNVSKDCIYDVKKGKSWAWATLQKKESI